MNWIEKSIYSVKLCLLASLASGCTAATDWQRSTIVVSARDAAYRECSYEASKAVASYGDFDGEDATWTGVIVDALGETISQSVRSDSLIRECMRTRGYENN